MSNEKLSIQNLVDALSRRADIAKKDSDAFLRDFVRILQDVLLRDGSVKVKGLGTFKLQWNASRKSVNVQTGESFEIAGHYKIDFSPEQSMRDFVNREYAHLETVTLGEPQPSAEEKERSDERVKMQMFSQQASEIASLLSDIESLGNAPREEIRPAEPVVVPEKTEILQPVVNQIIEEEKPQEIPAEIIPEEKPEVEESEPVSESEAEENISGNDENPAEAEPETPEKKKRVLPWLLLILLAALAAGGYFFREQILAQFNSEETENPAEAEPEPAVVADSVVVEIPDSASVPQPVYEIPDVPENVEENADDTDDFDENASAADDETFCQSHFSGFDINECETLALVEVKEGRRLAWYATHYYGSYQFWPYIYMANRDVLASPDKLEAGMYLKIPKIPLSMLDTDDDDVLRWCAECTGL